MPNAKSKHQDCNWSELRIVKNQAQNQPKPQVQEQMCLDKMSQKNIGPTLA